MIKRTAKAIISPDSAADTDLLPRRDRVRLNIIEFDVIR